jgi:predicted RNA-binding Zn ribbon-like protein
LAGESICLAQERGRRADRPGKADSFGSGQDLRGVDPHQLAAGVELPRAMARLQLAREPDGCCWRWTGDDDVRYPMWRAVHDAAELLTSGQLSRVRKCPECAWLFWDASKNQSKRWCEMSVCGSRAKARRFYQRHG